MPAQVSSSSRHFCDTCQYWISGHPRNIAKHEKSEAHQARIQRLLREMHQKEKKRKKDADDLAKEILKVEEKVYELHFQKYAPAPKPVKKHQVLRLAPGMIGPAGPGEDERYDVIKDSPAKPGQITSAPINNFPLPPTKIVDIAPQFSGPVSATPFPSTGDKLRDIWMMSTNSETKQPYYFNTITGEIRDTDPSGDVETPGGVYGVRAMTGKEMHEQRADAAIAELLPSVNDMVEAYKQHLLNKTLEKPPVNAILSNDSDKEIEVKTKPESKAEISIAGGKKVVLVKNSNNEFMKLNLHTYINFKNSNKNNSETVDNAQISDSVNSVSTFRGDTINKQSTNQQQQPSIDSNTGLGMWETVTPEESKFGDYKELVNDNQSEAEKIYPVNENCTFFSGNEDRKQLNTAQILAGFREDADAKDFLNEDDCKLYTKDELILKLDPVKKEIEIKNEIPEKPIATAKMFVKRNIKPVASKKR